MHARTSTLPLLPELGRRTLACNAPPKETSTLSTISACSINFVTNCVNKCKPLTGYGIHSDDMNDIRKGDSNFLHLRREDLNFLKSCNTQSQLLNSFLHTVVKNVIFGFTSQRSSTWHVSLDTNQSIFKKKLSRKNKHFVVESACKSQTPFHMDHFIIASIKKSLPSILVLAFFVLFKYCLSYFLFSSFFKTRSLSLLPVTYQFSSAYVNRWLLP